MLKELQGSSQQRATKAYLTRLLPTIPHGPSLQAGLQVPRQDRWLWHNYVMTYQVAELHEQRASVRSVGQPHNLDSVPTAVGFCLSSRGV
jgi:hypothetical protein